MLKYESGLPLMVLGILVVSIPGMALGATENFGDGEQSPSYYYPDTAGLVLQYEATIRTDRDTLSISTDTVSFDEFVEFDGVPAWLFEMTTEKIDANGMPKKFSMSVFQQVDNYVSKTRAYQFPNGKVLRYKDFFVDLKGPLVEGAAWQFACPMSHYAGAPQVDIDFEYKSTVEKTGVSVSTPAGQFTDCILIRELGKSVSPVTVSCPDGTIVKTYVQVDRLRYWAPFFGGVKETSIERYGVVSSPEEACLTYYYSSELAKVLVNPK